MQNENHWIIKALTPGELAAKYEVTTKTLKTWLDPHREKIGKRFSKYFTPRQVYIIYNCIEPPDFPGGRKPKGEDNFQTSR